MSYLYRPSIRVEAQAAMAKLTAAERAAHEEGNLHMLRASIERTLWHLDPQSDLAKHLRETNAEIRRHSLKALLPKQPTPRKARQHTAPYQAPEAEEIPERFSHMRLDQASTKRASTLPPGRAATMSLPPTKATRYPSRPRQEPIIELSSDASSDLSDLDSDDVDTPEQRESAPISDESAATSDMTGSAKPDSIPTQDPMPAQDPTPSEDQLPNQASKKRAAEGDDEASPVTKRVKGWLSHFTGGYASK